MKQVVKVTALVMLVSLLSGCSKDETAAISCEQAQRDYIEYRETAMQYWIQSKEIKGDDPIALGDKYIAEHYMDLYFNRSYLTVLANRKCFTDEEIEKAYQMAQ